MYQTDKEVAHRIEYITKFMDNVLDEDTSNLSYQRLYCTGGTVRRLYMLQNDIPLNKSDWDALYSSDIDCHAVVTQYSPVTVFDKFGLHEVKPESTPYSNPVIRNMTIQNIRVNAVVSEPKLSLRERLKAGVLHIGNMIERFNKTKSLDINNVKSVQLPFDIDSCKFIYSNGGILNLRESESEDFFDDIVLPSNQGRYSYRSLSRLLKYEKYGFKYSPSNIRDYIQKLEAVQYESYVHNDEATNVTISFNKES